MGLVWNAPLVEWALGVLTSPAAARPEWACGGMGLGWNGPRVELAFGGMCLGWNKPLVE